MDVVIRNTVGEAEVTIAEHGQDVTLGDLIERTTGRPAPTLVFVDGRAVPAVTPLEIAALLNGTIVDVVAPDDTESDQAAVALITVAGAAAGRARPLAPGRYRIGPGRQVNVDELAPGAVDAVRVTLDVRPNGAAEVAAPGAQLDGEAVEGMTPWRSGVLTVADRAFELRSVNGAEPVRQPLTQGVDGAAAFNRPPRPAAEPAPAPLTVPEGGKQVRESRRFPLLAMLAPIPLSIGMAVLIGNPRYMLFGLLSPVMMLANWVEDRRSRRREREHSIKADTAAVTQFGGEVAERFAADLARARRAHPTLADLLDRAMVTDPRLWERRSEHDDAFVLPLGLADQRWTPELARRPGSIVQADEVVAAQGPLPAAPVVVDLLIERGLGVVGDGAAARGVARAVIVAAATLHGPADVDIVVCAEPERAGAWEWVKWLPHSRPRGGPQIFASADAATAWAGAVAAAHERPLRPTRPGHITLVVADGAEWWRDRTAPLRAVLADPTMPVRFVALTDDVHALPAVCTTYVTLDGSGRATVDRMLHRTRIDAVLPNTVDSDLALEAARALAPLDDPELPTSGGSSLPERVPILDVVGIDEPTVELVRSHWVAADGQPRTPNATIGVSARGAFTVDLVSDGPHGLVAGTTGAGKSELLRSLVVGLAVNLPPDELNVVLIDFKGGSAFDACAHLPHTVGLVTDLDEHLAGRVLRCLRAELGHRERILRDAGVASLDEHRRLPQPRPLPRLLVVVDEFAFLALEFPEFMPALVDIAQRGRSLGLHLMLATQRPAGVVDNKIKANTNLRIALRVQDDGDSMDVVGTRDAAAIPRRIPGRAIARLGAGELVEFQSAFATSTRGRRETDELELRPYVLARELSPMEHRLASTAHRAVPGHEPATTDLARIVAAITAAANELGQSDQRRPYPDPLPNELPLARLLADNPGDAVPFALVDLPDQQRQDVRWWRPGPDGSMIVYGIAGSGTSSLLATLALGMAERLAPDDAHLYVIDADTNLLAPLDQLPHAGAVVRLDDGERLARVVRHLVGEVDRRRRLAIDLGGPARVVDHEPALVLFVDNVGAVRQFLEDRRDLAAVWPGLELVIRDGRSLGICAVLTATQERALPGSMAAQLPDRLAMRLADRMAYTSFGLRPADIPTFVPGRALSLVDQAELQIANPPADLAAAVAGITEPAVERPPIRIDPLPAEVPLSSLVPRAARVEGHLRLPIGLDLRDVEPAVLELELGSTAFVTGPSRSGRSTVLANIATALHRADPGIGVHAVSPRGGPLDRVLTVNRRASTPVEVAGWVDEIIAGQGARVVLIDDADRLGGPSFERLAAVHDDLVAFVIAARPDGLRSISHWTRPLQQSRTGVLLRPTTLDGDLLRVQLATRLPRFDAGRGYLVNDGELVPVMIRDTRAVTVAGRRGDGIGIEIGTAALRGVRLDLDVPGRLAVAAEEPITRPGDDALLDAFVRLTARLDGHEGIPTRLAWFPPDAIILTCDATGLMPAEVNRLTGDLDGVTATTSVESGARRWLLAVRWDHERSVRLAGLASSAGLEVEACEPAPIALARVLSSEPTITRRVTDDGCGWDAILADGVPRAAAGSAGSYRRSPDLVADNLRRADLGRLPDDSSQAAGAVRMVIDAMAGDRFQRGGHPVGVALTGDLYPPYPPDDVRSTARQAVALGAAIAAAGLAGRVRAVQPLAVVATPRTDDRRPWVVERLPDVTAPVPTRTAWWRRLFDNFGHRRTRPTAPRTRRASDRRPRKSGREDWPT